MIFLRTRLAAMGCLLVLAACGSTTHPGAASDGGVTDATSGGGSGGGGSGGEGGEGEDAIAPPPGDGGGAGDAASVDAGPSLPATITVDPATKVGAIGPSFVGLSYEKAQLQKGFFRGDNAALIAMVDLLGPGLLRVGGNTVAETVWQSFDAGAPAPDAAAPSIITTAVVDGLAAFAKAAGWKVLYGVNLKTSSASAAEDEAKYAAGALGASLDGFEIGNEPDLYPAVVSSPGTWNYAAFTADWTKFAAGIHAGAPAAPLTGPASADHYTTWTVPFAADESASIVLLTQHYYVANGQAATSTIDLLLQPDPTLVTELQGLSDAATKNKIAGGYRLSECNSFYNGGAPDVSDAYGTALWVIDFLFDNAQNGSSGINLHGGGNGPGYTPIADANGAVVEARPEFYGMLLFSKVGQGPVLKTTGVPSSINVSAYAVAAAPGETRVILSNKDRTTTLAATVDIGAAVTSASAIRLQGPALESPTGVTLGGVAIGADGTFTPGAPETLTAAGTTVQVSVPPASAVLITAK